MDQKNELIEVYAKEKKESMAQYEIMKDKAFHYQDAYETLKESLRTHICNGC